MQVGSLTSPPLAPNSSSRASKPVDVPSPRAAAWDEAIQATKATVTGTAIGVGAVGLPAAVYGALTWGTPAAEACGSYWGPLCGSFVGLIAGAGYLQAGAIAGAVAGSLVGLGVGLARMFTGSARTSR